MRLINVSTLELREFFGNRIPPYAILSHTWGDEEISLQEWLTADRSAISYKEGYRKIVRACELAFSQGYEYVWVDTNCIDKTSSAELSEAINTMFHWYATSQVCYAYLADVAGSPRSRQGVLNSIERSRWFTRGWTLQELLAPQRVEFYSKDWACEGTKESLATLISKVTGIQKSFLSCKYLGVEYPNNDTDKFMVRELFHAVPLEKASIATRMSWVASRETSRLEDMAYCMLGILGINMPLLYGEGAKAFERLQKEIIQNSDDHSIFCWTWNPWRHPRFTVRVLGPFGR